MMTGFMALMLAMQLAIGVLLVGLSIPMILRKLSPNRLHGFRTRRTLADPAIWYEANAFAGRALAIAGCSILIGAVTLCLTPAFQGKAFPVACLVVDVVSVGLAVGSSVWYLHGIGR